MTNKKTSRRTTRRPPAPPEPPPYPRVFESFRDPLNGAYQQDYHLSDSPSCGNGEVSIRRYEITIRRVEEPVEILRARLLKLWRTMERNHHNVDIMWRTAHNLGVENPREFLRFEDQGIECTIGSKETM